MECQRRITPREFRLWQGWFRYQWNHPTLTDYYLAQVSMQLQAIAYILLKRNKRVRFEDFLLKFDWTKGQETMSVEQATTFAKAKWFGVTGYGKHR